MAQITPPSQEVPVCPPEKVLGRLLFLCVNFLNKHVAVFTLCCPILPYIGAEIRDVCALLCRFSELPWLIFFPIKNVMKLRFLFSHHVVQHYSYHLHSATFSPHILEKTKISSMNHNFSTIPTLSLWFCISESVQEQNELLQCITPHYLQEKKKLTEIWFARSAQECIVL